MLRWLYGLPFDHTNDINLVFSRSISFIWGMGGWLIWNERDVSQSSMTMTATYG